MAPILIDESGIKRLGAIALAAVALAFIAGYVIGNQQAGFFTEAGNDLPELSTVDTTVSNDQKDADTPPEKMQASKEVVKQKSDRSVKPKSSGDFADDATKRPVKSKGSKVASSTQVASSTKANSKVSTKASTAKVDTEKAGAPQASVQSSETLSATDKAKGQESGGNLIKYSVQTAVYGHLSRAEKNMNELLEKNIEAYVTDYINKSNKVWYNVRFGYYRDKKSALAALEDYRQEHGGDGYLVNFSAERIVDFDEQKYYEDSIELKAGNESAPKQEGVQLPVSGNSGTASSESSAAGELSVSNNDAQIR